MKRAVIYYDTAPEQFLEQLVPFLSVNQPVQAAALGESGEAEESSENIPPHPLLNPTLQLISMSKATKLAFCPTIDTLRAYLSNFVAPD